MYAKKLLIFFLVLFSITLFTAGCRKNNRGTVPVKVTINYKGSPVSEAIVVLRNDEGNYANGSTDKNGVVWLSTFEPKDGALPGTYKVTVDKSELKVTLDPNKPAGDNEISSETIFHIPEKYSSVETSGLSMTINEKGPNEETFDLTD